MFKTSEFPWQNWAAWSFSTFAPWLILGTYMLELSTPVNEHKLNREGPWSSEVKQASCQAISDKHLEVDPKSLFSSIAWPQAYPCWSSTLIKFEGKWILHLVLHIYYKVYLLNIYVKLVNVICLTSWNCNQILVICFVSPPKIFIFPRCYCVKSSELK